MARYGGSRHCASCARAVVDLSRVTEREATALLLVHGGSCCARIHAGEDGSAVFRSEQTPRASRRRSLAPLAAAALSTLACTTPDPTVAHSTNEAPRPSATVSASSTWAPHVEPPFVDRDEDGVADPIDKCPNEPGRISSDGCPATFIGLVNTDPVILEQVQFRKGSAALQPASSPLLDAVAQVVIEHPELEIVQVRGHAFQEQKGIGKRRAEAVFAYLVKKGVPKERLMVVDSGTELPIVSGSSPDAGRNRRVDFQIVKRAELPAPAQGSSKPI